MKRKNLILFLLFATILLFQSCEVQILDDSRILVKGNLVDSNNNPLPNIAVRCQSYGEILGETRSDANGQFQFTSLESENNYPLNIMINLKSSGYDYYVGGYNYYELTENPDYSAKKYFNDAYNRSNSSTYNLGQIQLNEAAHLTILFTNIPGDNNRVAYKLEFQSAVCAIDLNSNNTEDCLIADDYYNQLDINSTNFQTNLDSQLGTTVLLKYILNEQPEQTISIPLTNLENTYVFEY
ncbi:carboxypeptidase-like regulatory domain-containing protein [Aequorivita todarodis]|uniref:carboxypeptidase-like regulatory domain-containing protein n=1 Tax=Aequorivita todarodis TaxID=2036821 RepID=UPI0023509767|nr:carboxypeptidase-like regulatory domain-containing protein [Aequorivita todarodis]MDC8000876.1 carboxypeptidase-like regulatory domain-containing protein [Aequorivita todarodis]